MTNPRRLLCLACGVETEDGTHDACPACGDSLSVPADLDQTLTIRITAHELRILTIWAQSWERNHVRTGSLPSPLPVILARLGTQTGIALTLSQEIADIRAAYPGSSVQVMRDGTVTDE